MTNDIEDEKTFESKKYGEIVVNMQVNDEGDSLDMVHHFAIAESPVASAAFNICDMEHLVGENAESIKKEMEDYFVSYNVTHAEAFVESVLKDFGL